MTLLMLSLLTALAAAMAARRRRTERRLRRAVGHATPATRGMPRALRRNRRRPPAEPIPSPLLLELLAALLESGAPPPTALRHVARSLARVDDARALPLHQLAATIEQGMLHRPVHDGPSPVVDGRRTRAPDAGLDALHDVLRLAAVAGLPPASLVRRAATEERRRVSAVRRKAIRRLEVLLVLPVGVCLLPAFVVLGIVPVVVDLFGA